MGDDDARGNDGNGTVSNKIGHHQLDDYNGMTIGLTEQSPSLMLHSGDCVPKQTDRESVGSRNSHSNTGSVTSTATGSTASQQSFRASSEYSEQMEDIPLVESDMDILFDINSPIQINSPIPTSTEAARVYGVIGGSDDPHATERMPKERHDHQHTGSLQQEQIPSPPPVTATDGTKPATQHAQIPLSTYMDLDLSSFMYTADPSGQIMAFSQGDEEPSSLPPDLDQFHLPSPLSMGLGPLSGLIYPTALQQPTTPQLALDASRERHDATASAGTEYISQTTSASTSTAGSGPTTLADTPVLIRDGQRSFPSFTIDGGIHLSIKNDLAGRLGGDTNGDTDGELPSSRMCADFLASYVSNFHGHLPIIHLSTFSPATHPSPLVLIMCSIGALYRLDRKRARCLFELSRKAMDNFDVSTPAVPNLSQPVIVKGYPLWSVQTRVLLTFYAIMSGDMDLTMAAMRENGVYTIVYHEARTSLQEHRRDFTQLGWESWVTIESWKRLLGSMLICSTMIVVVFNQNPGMNSTMDLEFDALEDEKLWGAQSSAEWRELCEAAARQQQPNRHERKKSRTMKGILTDIMIDQRPNKPFHAYEVSAFSGFILMHAIVVHMWQRAQVLQALVGHAPQPGAISNPTEDAFHDMLMCNGLQTLARCQAFLDGARYEGNGGNNDVVKDDNMALEEEDVEKEASLVFNANAILRIAHARLFRPDSIHSSIDLTNLHGNRTDASIDLFVSSKMERGTLVLKAVEKAFEGLREPVRIGHLFVRKTAAFRWSVEQAVAGWDCALLVSKFVHAIEMDVLEDKIPTADERMFCEKVKDVLREAEADVEEGYSVAAAVAKTWSWFLRDVWIWGLTPVMGEALDQVGEAYTRALASKTQNAI
ncbi:hypothetical protein Sste5346_010120 [Sporothrix stenoceras]|uniref:Xylanolytic transcriptional activator regulatory domain-containing protein n=1 Tax=Sporothrix stenoceras TaxID=5173 RepID=A0ABR3YH19_9PEZI